MYIRISDFKYITIVKNFAHKGIMYVFSGHKKQSNAKGSVLC